MGEFSAFVIDKKCIKDVHKLISNIVLSFKEDVDKYILKLYFKCRKYFWGRFKQTCLIVVVIQTRESCFGLFIWWML